LRCFVSLEISDEKILDSLVSFQRELVGTGADLKLVERENIHFTLKFLGEISEGMKDDAHERLLKLRIPSVTVSVQGIGAFPNVFRPNIVWVGVSPADSSKVVSIAKEVIDSLSGIGESDERGFQPHTTLARVKSGRNRESLSSLLKSSSARQFGPIQLMSVRLKSSQLTPNGPIYRDLGVYALN
jgi:RNA 2',3'-cyclic 3'-phosphodiesterase